MTTTIEAASIIPSLGSGARGGGGGGGGERRPIGGVFIPTSTSGGTIRLPTRAAKKGAMWHHSRFSIGFNPVRVATLSQNAEVTLAAERNFEIAYVLVPL